MARADLTTLAATASGHTTSGGTGVGSEGDTGDVDEGEDRARPVPPPRPCSVGWRGATVLCTRALRDAVIAGPRHYVCCARASHALIQMLSSHEASGSGAHEASRVRPGRGVRPLTLRPACPRSGRD